MKTFTTILILAAALLADSTARAASDSLEIVLNDEHVSFYTATNLPLEATFRNIGVTNMDRVSLLTGLSVIWDGQEYAIDPKMITVFINGMTYIAPKAGWRQDQSLSAFPIPPEKVTLGRHTISLKEGEAVSNQLTIFIGR
jgi:hypothetical protein